jgi:hypothetical protein
LAENPTSNRAETWQRPVLFGDIISSFDARLVSFKPGNAIDEKIGACMANRK